MFREMRRLAEREVSKKKSFADVTCDLELVETLPESLVRRGYAKRLPVEHKSTFEVRSLRPKRLHSCLINGITQIEKYTIELPIDRPLC